ncbi:MAG TPA: hypothetical protein DDW45_00540 [Gammaproteobacteria bacterium]|nr:hypothetical protein [Gammaproteobacteria bacterium]
MFDVMPEACIAGEHGDVADTVKSDKQVVELGLYVLFFIDVASSMINYGHFQTPCRGIFNQEDGRFAN